MNQKTKILEFWARAILILRKIAHPRTSSTLTDNTFTDARSLKGCHDVG
ncbi:hypothetical protein ACN4EG_02520 [Alkalinema pantanalense CENA528]